MNLTLYCSGVGKYQSKLLQAFAFHLVLDRC